MAGGLQKKKREDVAGAPGVKGVPAGKKKKVSKKRKM
jgi:hypothetical protein